MSKTHIKLVEDFFNKAAKELDKKYFPDLKFYRDDDNCAAVHYALECFSNGVLAYDLLIQKLSKACNDTKENIHNLIKEYVQDFGDYIYDPLSPDRVVNKWPHSMYRKNKV